MCMYDSCAAPHAGSTILVEGEVLAVTAVEHCFEGREDAVVHCVDLVGPKKWEWRVQYTMHPF